MIPDSLKNTLYELSQELYAVHARQNEYVLFGSTPLIMRGIIDREPGDVDIFVTRRVWGALLPRYGWEVEVPAAHDPPILVFRPDDGPAVNAFFDWTRHATHITVDEFFRDAEEVDGWSCASNEAILKHKEGAIEKMEKHLPDIQAIKEVTNGHS